MYCKDWACDEPIIAAMARMKDHWAKCKKQNQCIGQLDSGFQRSLYVVVSERRVTSGQVSTSYQQCVVSFYSCFFFSKGFWGKCYNQGNCCGMYASESHWKVRPRTSSWYYLSVEATRRNLILPDLPGGWKIEYPPYCSI